MQTIEKKPLTVLLGSKAKQKIDGSICGIDKALPDPSPTGLRRFIVIRDIDSDDPTAPQQIEIQEKFTRGGELSLEVPRVLYTGPFNSLQALKELVSVETLKKIVPTVWLFAQDSASFLNPQPVNEHKIYKLEEGYAGAKNRVDSAKRKNDEAGENKIDYDYVVGIENAQVYSRIERVRTFFRRRLSRNKKSEKAAVTDTAFIYIENREGDWEVSHSAGVVLQDGNHGLDLFHESAETGFQVPAGHLSGAVEKQDPHIEATGDLYSRAELLTPPIAIVLKQLHTQSVRRGA